MRATPVLVTHIGVMGIRLPSSAGHSRTRPPWPHRGNSAGDMARPTCGRRAGWGAGIRAHAGGSRWQLSGHCRVPEPDQPDASAAGPPSTRSARGSTSGRAEAIRKGTSRPSTPDSLAPSGLRVSPQRRRTDRERQAQDQHLDAGHPIHGSGPRWGRQARVLDAGRTLMAMAPSGGHQRVS